MRVRQLRWGMAVVVVGVLGVLVASGCTLLPVPPPPPPPTTVTSTLGVYASPITNQVPTGQGGQTWIYAPASAAGQQVRVVWGCGYSTLSDTTVTLEAAGGQAVASVPMPAAILHSGYYYCSVWEYAPSTLPPATGHVFIQWSDPSTWMVDIVHGTTGHPTDSVATRSASWPFMSIYSNDGIEPVPDPWNGNIVVLTPAADAGEVIRVTVYCPASSGLPRGYWADQQLTIDAHGQGLVALPTGFFDAIARSNLSTPPQDCTLSEATTAAIPAATRAMFIAGPSAGGSGGGTVGVGIEHGAPCAPYAGCG